MSEELGEPRRIDEHLFAAPKGDPGFGHVPSWLLSEPVSRPAKAARWARYRWWDSLRTLSYQLRAPQPVKDWLYRRWSPARKAWQMAQVKHASLTLKGFWNEPA
jgi:hypothetical protein